MLADIASWTLLIAGSAFLLIGSFGLLRLPDFFSRLHAAGISDTLGIVLVVLGLMIQAGLSLIAVKLAFLFIFLFFTSPTATHAIARAALHSGLRPWLRAADPATKDQPPSPT